MSSPAAFAKLSRSARVEVPEVRPHLVVERPELALLGRGDAGLGGEHRVAMEHIGMWR